MSELQIKHEFGNYYIVAEYVEDKDEEYLVRMITENNIKGHLACRVAHDGERKCLMYDVTNMISLKNEFENKYLALDDLYDLFEKIKNIYAIGARHLLDDQYYYLNPNYIYRDVVDDDIKVLYIPGYNKDKSNRYYDLADFLIQRINRKDDSCIQLAYQFYRMSGSETFSISMFLNIIDKEITLNKKQMLQVQEPKIDYEDEVLEEPEEKVLLGWRLPSALTAIGIICLVVYLAFFKNTVYSLYLLIGLIFIGITSLALWGRSIYKFISEKDEAEIVIPRDPVTVAQYWGDEETVVLQDETVVLNEIDEEKQCRLEWKEDGVLKKYVVKNFPIIIGKMQDEVDCFIDDKSISRLHAKIVKRGTEMCMFDLNSTNGTVVDGMKLQAGEEIRLNKDSKIKLGNIVLSIVC